MQPLLIVATKAVPANDLKGFIAWLKANPDRASAAIPGVGCPANFTTLAHFSLPRRRNYASSVI
jgi:hypothetical protein